VPRTSVWNSLPYTACGIRLLAAAVLDNLWRRFYLRRTDASCTTFGMVEGNGRQPGRPVRRWIDDILKWCNKDLSGAALLTVDRVDWRRFVTSLDGPPAWQWIMATKEKKKNASFLCIMFYDDFTYLLILTYLHGWEQRHELLFTSIDRPTGTINVCP